MYLQVPVWILEQGCDPVTEDRLGAALSDYLLAKGMPPMSSIQR